MPWSQTWACYLVMLGQLTVCCDRALLLFTIMSTTQNTAWICFSTILSSTKDYYSITDAQVERLVEVATIVWIPATLVMSPLVDRLGLRFGVIFSTCCIAIGAACRYFGGRSYVWILVGQTINGLAGPVICNNPVQLAAEWFPAHQRIVATGIAFNAQSIGVAVGFLFAPYIVSQPDDVPDLMRWLGVWAAASLALVCTFPKAPALPPSTTASAVKHGFLAGGKKLVRNKMFLLLAFAWAVCAGTIQAVISFLDQFMGDMKHNGHTYSDASIGVVGFVGNFSVIFGGVVIPLAIDVFSWHRQMKWVLLVTLLAVAGLLGAMAFLVCYYSGPWLSVWITGLPFILFCAIGGGVSPVFMELAGEHTFPVSEETAAAYSEIHASCAVAFHTEYKYSIECIQINDIDC
eukprot:m.580309 g.580309  ORF g.580309 m.580309 type:complete len:404 (-) comp22321_c0_seq12:1679-2890(-)